MTSGDGCPRAGCAEQPPHDPAEHINPRSPHYDGPGVALAALPQTARSAARNLLDAGAPVAEVMDLVDEIHRLRRSIGHCRADADRRIADAIRQSEDCEFHGEKIKELNGQLDYYTRHVARLEKANAILLSLVFEIEKLPNERVLSGAQLKAAAGRINDQYRRAFQGRG